MESKQSPSKVTSMSDETQLPFSSPMMKSEESSDLQGSPNQNSLNVKKDKDYLDIKNQSKMMVLFGNETLLFSEKIKKINMFEWTQDRKFIITNEKVYNIKKNKVKRHIMFHKIGGLSKTVGSNSKGEFTIHVPTEYDYRFISDRRDEIFEVIKQRFVEKMQVNLPIFGIAKGNLRDFTTTEKDMKRGQSRFPPMQFRLKDEDLIKESQSQMVKAEFIDNTFTLLDDYQQNVAIRNQQFQETKDFNDEDDEDDDEYDNPTPAKLGEETGALIFTREKDQASLKDFEVKKMIGKGTFGKVYLVQNVNTQRIYAMKCIRKDIIIDNEQYENIKLEKDILFTIEHPFIVNMEYVFQNEYRIYFLMKFIKGGELFRHLVKVKRFTGEQVKFFVVQIAIALGHLHSKSILYRDLKPENILFGEDGYLFLADFGLAKMVGKNELANSFCGTAEYLAPEMLIGSGHDYSVDWWALGILIYEMLVGIPPFFHRNKHRMYFLIKESPVNFPDPIKHGIEVSPKAKDLIKRLLEKNRKKRLGTNGGLQEVLAHPFFQGVNIEQLLNKEIVPPYMPDIGDDLKYFDTKLTSKDEFAESVIDGSNLKLIQQNQHIFKRF